MCQHHSEQFDVITLDLPIVIRPFAIRECGRIDNDDIEFVASAQICQVFARVILHELKLAALKLIEFEIAASPVEIGLRPIHGRHRVGSPIGRIDAKGASVSKQVQYAFSFRRIAHQGTRDPMVEKQAGIDIVGQVHPEPQSPLAHHDLIAHPRRFLMLRLPSLPPFTFKKHFVRINFQRFRSRPLHQIEPIGMLSHITIVRPFVFGQVQMVLVAIDNQWDLRNVPLIEPVAVDIVASGPATQMPALA